MDTRKTLTMRATADRLGVHVNTVRNWTKAGKIEFETLPGSGFRRIPVSEVERLERARVRSVITRTDPCCDMMKRQLELSCDVCEEECPDKVINFDIGFEEYGLVIPDGGESMYIIRFCPWCGTRLPKPGWAE